MSISEDTRASLVAKLSANVDEIAWLEFWNRYGALIHGFVRRQGLSPSDCEDVTQDVLLRLMRAMPNFIYDPSRGRFRNYLKTVTVNAVKRHVTRGSTRHQGFEPLETVTPPEEESSAESTWETEWQQYHVRRAMRLIRAEFSQRDLAAFYQFALNGLSAEETARGLGTSVDQVYQAKYRIIRRLKDVIARQRSMEG